MRGDKKIKCLESIHRFIKGNDRIINSDKNFEGAMTAEYFNAVQSCDNRKKLLKLQKNWHNGPPGTSDFATSWFYMHSAFAKNLKLKAAIEARIQSLPVEEAKVGKSGKGKKTKKK